MRKKIDMTGRPIGRLLVIEECGRDSRGEALWLCRCECGNEVIVRGGSLRNENTTSCGCYWRERAAESNTTHGASQTRLYAIWQDMLTRVGVRKGASEEVKRAYKDRGITVCDEWLVFENFRDWALSHGYKDDLQIDRRDNDKGYCPENCRWVTPKENVNNRRNTIRLEDGTPLAMFCSKVGIETTGKNGKPTKQYYRILQAYRKHKTIHPDLLDALKSDTRRQCRLLYQTSMIRQEFEGRLKDLKQKVDALKRSISNPHKGTWSPLTTPVNGD